MKEVFLKFLDSRCAREQYMANFDLKAIEGCNSIDEFLDDERPVYYLRAFDWEDTPEGDAYWGFMSLAWENLVNDAN